MGIDIDRRRKRGHNRKSKRSSPKSHDPYLLLLVKLYRFLSRRTSSVFNRKVLDRLCHSRENKVPLSVAQIARFMKNQKEGVIAVVVAPVLDDPRLLDVPKLRVCALRFSTSARTRIVNAGGEALTFDQLALKAPTGSNTLLLRGPRKAAKKYRYFGKVGVPGSHVRPRVIGKSRKEERARGRRASRGYSK